jgi:hypothetical protein
MLVELEDRPRLLGLFGVQNAVSGTTEPIIACALASRGQPVEMVFLLGLAAWSSDNPPKRVYLTFSSPLATKQRGEGQTRHSTTIGLGW